MKNAEAFLPIVCAVFTNEFANSSASCNDFIKAPVPHFTSNTNASEPSATFFDKMLAVIKGTDSTVPVTSLNAYKSLSAGTISSVCPIIAKPFSEMIFLNWSGDIFTLYPLIDSSLSRVPPVWPKALPLIIGICTPQEATIGARGKDILSPTPPVECSIDLEEVKYPSLPDTEYFTFDTLPPHYKTLRIPFTDTIGSLSARKGYLRLIGRDSITSWNTQSLVARRLQHHFAEATVKMEFHPKNFQQMAGLTVMYDTYNFFYLYMSRGDDGDNVLRVFVRDSLKFYNPLMKGVSIGDCSTVWLRVRVEECALTYYYSLDGISFTPMCNALDCSNLSDEAYCDIGHEGHTGTFIGMCCQDIAGTGERCYADFEFMSYKALK